MSQSAPASDLDRGECRECPLVERRAFLRDALAGAATAALASLGIARAAAAFPVTETRALRHAGDTRAYVIPAADGAQIDKANEIILVRWQNAVYAFDLSCPHQNTALRWNAASHRFQCPKHKSQYQPDGEFITGRATRGMDRFAVRRDGTNVVVDVDTVYKQDEDPAGWTGAVLKL